MFHHLICWEGTLKDLVLVRAALETCHIGIVIVDQDGYIVLWNTWMVEHARLDANEVCGKHLEEVFPEVTNSRFIQSVQMALHQGMSSLLSQRLHGAPLELFPTNQYQPSSERLQQVITISPLIFPDKASHCLIQVNDVTPAVKREQLLRSQTREMQLLADQYRTNELHMKAVLDNALDAIITANDQGYIEMVNPAAVQIFQYQPEEMIGQSIFRLIPNLYDPMQKPVDDFLFSQQSRVICLCRAVEGQQKDGSAISLELSLSEMLFQQKHWFVGILRDITQRKQIEEALIQEKERALVTLASIGDAVVTTDAQGHIQYMNPVAEQLVGWDNVSALHLPLSDVFRIYDMRGELICEGLYTHCLETSETIALMENTLLRHRQGRRFYIEGTLAPIRAGGQIVGVVLAFHDVSQARQMAHQLSYQATHDSLTGLVNRFEFERRLTQAISDTRHHKRKHVLCYMDLDQFKVVNDTCGHTAGDELLRQVSTLLRSKIRDTDTLARLGGDEFGVLLQGCGIEKAHHIAEMMREAIHDFRFMWEGKTFSIGVSIGLVAITDESVNVSNVLSAADTACYAAKDTGRNRVWIYQNDDLELSQRHGQMQWASRVTQAIEENRFLLYCQPIVNLRQPQHCLNRPQIELLVRMVDEKGTLVPPTAFIPAAERYNMMSTIDQWVISEAFSKYHHLCINHPELLMNINLSSMSLGDEHFLEFVYAQFNRHHVPPEMICFEITETAAIVHLTKALNFIKSVKGLGCRFALDDFGSGLSSFAYLKNLPIDYLKIDGAFVKDMLEDPVDCAMVESINKIGHIMHLETIAECVETLEILQRLREIKVNYVQGFSISEPIPLANLEHFHLPLLPD